MCVWNIPVRICGLTKRGPVILAALPPHHNMYHVIELRSEKWDCLQTNTHCDKTKLHCWRENCTVYFSTTHPVNVRSFFTNYVVLFVNQAELYRSKCSSFVAIRADSAHMPVCCTSRTNDLLRDVSHLSPISCSFPQHLSSACHRAVQKWIYAPNLFAYL
jgi:hypothetical protein